MNSLFVEGRLDKFLFTEINTKAENILTQNLSIVDKREALKLLVVLTVYDQIKYGKSNTLYMQCRL